MEPSVGRSTSKSPTPLPSDGNPRLFEGVRIGIGATEYPGLSVSEVLSAVTRYGVPAIELIAPRNVTRDTVGQVQQVLDRSDLEVNAISAFTPLNTAVFDQIRQVQGLINECIDIASALHAPYAVTYCGGNPLLDETAAIDRYAELIQPNLHRARDSGVTLLIENLFDVVPPDIPPSFRQWYRPNDAMRTARGSLRLLDTIASPWLRLNFDPGNYLIAGEEPYPYAYDVLQKYIANIHLKDPTKYDPEIHGDADGVWLQRDSRGEFICVPIGAGAVNYDGLLSRLTSEGYQGSLVLEPHTGTGRLDAALRASLTYLSHRGFAARG